MQFNEYTQTHTAGTGTGTTVIMLRTGAQGREARDKIGEGGREAKKRKNSHKSCRRDVGNGAALGGNKKT